MDEEKKRILTSIWTSSGSGSFGGLNRLYTEAKKQITITKSDVKEFLNNYSSYALFKQSSTNNVLKRHEPLRTFQISQPGQLVALDVMYMSAIGGVFPYMMVAICAFTKFVIVKPMRSLSAVSAASAIKKIVDEFPSNIETVFTDRGERRVRDPAQDLSGTEFTNASVKSLLQRLGIRHVYSNPNSPNKTSFAERQDLSICFLHSEQIYTNTTWTRSKDFKYKSPSNALRRSEIRRRRV